MYTGLYGEPKLLTVVAPVVFDECGINLCREIKVPECLLQHHPTTEAIDLKVIDINFNLDDVDGSSVETIQKRPNCVRVTLSKIKVRFAAKLLDRQCRVLAEECFQALYLPDKDSPHCDDDTNPPSITVDLYAPYGVSYYGECKECCPTINYLGFVEGPERNNELRQGVDCQALAKVIELDTEEGCMAVGLTLYLKTVYFVQYRIKHAGVCYNRVYTMSKPDSMLFHRVLSLYIIFYINASSFRIKNNLLNKGLCNLMLLHNRKLI